MTPETKSRAGLPSDAEARHLVDRARRLRAETLAGLARAAWSGIARRLHDASTAAMPHARA